MTGGGKTGSKKVGETGLVPLTNLNPTWWWGLLNSSMVVGTLKSSI